MKNCKKLSNFRKIKNQIFLTFVFLILVNSLSILNAQIKTSISDEEKITNTIPFHYYSEPPKALLAPKVNVEKVLAADRKSDEEINRFGIRVATDFSIEDGTFYELEDFAIWKMRVKSIDATSLNFQFTDFNLPRTAQMYIYSLDEKMVMGPITYNNITNNKLATDLIYGEEAIIEIFLNNSDRQSFSLHLSNIIHGINPRPGTIKAYNSSLPCNVDVNCSEGDDFQLENDGVALIMGSDGKNICSGTLITNTCEDFTPFFLTAFHCLDNTDLDPDRTTLTPAEITQANSWVFRFNYEKPGCGGKGVLNWISVSGATFKSGFADTDFVLLELDDSPIGNENVSVVGFDITGTTPTSTTMIHHPDGDVKKISMDGVSPLVPTVPLEFANPAIPGLAGGTYFETTILPNVVGDLGVLEGGSSGSALFDSNKKIIGQLKSGLGVPDCVGAIVNQWAKLSSSWTGGGTNTTRLSNWLDPIPVTPTITNTERAPWIDGPNEICLEEVTYSLNENPYPNNTITWEVSPPELFSSTTSGTGFSFTITPLLYAKGNATITFTISHENSDLCNDVIAQKDVWIGTPNTMGQITGDNFVQVGASEVYYIENSAGIGKIKWTLPFCNAGSQCWSVDGGNNNNFLIVEVGEDSGLIQAARVNSCGAGGASIFPVTVTTEPDGDLDDDIFKIVIYPNPTNGVTTFEVLEGSYDEYSKIEVFDTYGDKVFENSVESPESTLDAFDFSVLNPGIYGVHIYHSAGIHFENLIITN